MLNEWISEWLILNFLFPSSNIQPSALGWQNDHVTLLSGFTFFPGVEGFQGRLLNMQTGLFLMWYQPAYSAYSSPLLHTYLHICPGASRPDSSSEPSTEGPRAAGHSDGGLGIWNGTAQAQMLLLPHSAFKILVNSLNFSVWISHP